LVTASQHFSLLRESKPFLPPSIEGDTYIQ
jgi:hypothetical protein